MAETKKPGWPKIGSIRKGDDGSNYIKLEENVKIFVDGQEVPLNDKRTVQLQDPRAKVTQLKEKGYIDEAEADKRLEKLSGMTWLRYDLFVPPPRN